MGACQNTATHDCSARVRRLRLRSCLRKGCRRKYQPQCWNQRYCQDPECLRQVRRWQAARRQAKHRQDAAAKTRHANTERERRQRATCTPQAIQDSGVAPRVVTQRKNFLLPLCARPGCHESPVISHRNPARFCCHPCSQAVRNVQDRERKWLSRGTSDGRKKRHFEYLAARQRRALVRGNGARPTPLQTSQE